MVKVKKLIFFFNSYVILVNFFSTDLYFFFDSSTASHLSDGERSALIKSARTVLDANGFESTPLLAGTGTGSAHQTVKLCKEAKIAGADYAIVISPGYFAFAMGRDKVALKAYFMEVLDKSPIPIMIYNFP